MYEKIIEIIVYVIAELRHHKNINDIDIEELKQLGYTKAEISTAFSWLVDKVEMAENLFTVEKSQNRGSFRVLHEVERELFTDDAWGELIQLQSLGIVSSEHIEMLIERAIMTGIGMVECQHVKNFVAHVVFNANISSSPNARFMLAGNDTIN
ncbi:MAG: DUF494 family protein [Ignavibacteriae bacterium]|nr:DUF494 family protein [Ignavibacteriota bacterium]